MRTLKCAKSRRSAARVRRIVSLFARCFEHRGRVEATPLLREKSCSRFLSRQSRRSNALLLCIVRGRIKKGGGAHTREPRDVPTLIVRSENVDDDAVDVTSTIGASIICHFAFVNMKRASPKLFSFGRIELAKYCNNEIVTS